MDPTTRFYLVLTAAMAALGALLSFTLAWGLRDRLPRGNTRVDNWNGAPSVPQPPTLPAPPSNDISFQG
jgi:hypothetical protein